MEGGKKQGLRNKEILCAKAAAPDRVPLKRKILDQQRN